MLLMSTFHSNYIANHFIFSTTSTISTSHRQMIEVLQGSTTTTTTTDIDGFFCEEFLRDGFHRRKKLMSVYTKGRRAIKNLCNCAQINLCTHKFVYIYIHFGNHPIM